MSISNVYLFSIFPYTSVTEVFTLEKNKATYKYVKITHKITAHLKIFKIIKP